MPLFQNQTAVISGGLGDIGRAIALELASHGANVGVSDVRPAADAQALLGQLGKSGVRASYESVDVADAGAVDRWIANVERDLGTPTLIIVNAAIVTVKGIMEITPEQWSRELRINLDGAFHMAQSGTKRILASGLPGRVVFIGSWAGHAPHQHIPAYCVAKAGLRMLCQCMAIELAPKKILVNEIAPGYVDAGLSGRFFEKDPVAREAARNKVPVRELIRADEVAHQVTYLCDPKNRHVTGSLVLMDGGLSLLRG